LSQTIGHKEDVPNTSLVMPGENPGISFCRVHEPDEVALKRNKNRRNQYGQGAQRVFGLHAKGGERCW
jgi:hypothetical protein